MSLIKVFKNYFFDLNRNVFLLAIVQVFTMTSLNLNMIISGLSGYIVAPYEWLSTFPLSLVFVFTMSGTIPSSLLMSRYGRKNIFLIGCILSSSAGLVMGLALISNNFIFFCVGSILLGIANSISSFYRYAATETVPDFVKPKAMSLVISAGLLAAFIAAEIAKFNDFYFQNSMYVASFFSMAMLSLICIPFIINLKIPLPNINKSRGRPISEIIFKFGMIKAILSASAGYSIMTYLMTATPLQIVNVCKFGLSTNAYIIQWHVIAMFAPSFFTGTLIQKFKAEKVIFFGIISYLIMIYFALFAITPIYYYLSLIFLGIGWNFLFLGGSSLIVSNVKPEEQGKIQGIADFIIFSSVAFASLIAGFLHYNIGWKNMVLGIIPLVILIIFLNLPIRNFEKRGT